MKTREETPTPPPASSRAAGSPSVRTFMRRAAVAAATMPPFTPADHRAAAENLDHEVSGGTDYDPRDPG